MFVMSPMSGSAMAVSIAISPGQLVPISMTASSWTLFSCRRVSGRPIRLFRFPSVLRTFRVRETMIATISFVEVFPELPVMAMTATGKRRRHSRAMSPRACRVSGTPMTGNPSGASASFVEAFAWIRNAAAPRSAARARQS